MRKTIFIAVCMLAGMSAWAQTSDALKAATDAALEIIGAQQAEQKVEKPKYWTESLMTNIKFGQTSLTNWAAGGDNTVTLQAFVDGNANYKKDDLFWNNRLQLDYGFVYASSKPILQKSDDRIYLESKLGYKTENMKKFAFTVNYDFKSQFNTGYDYKTPATPDGFEKLEDMPMDQLVDAWKGARVVKSGFLAPAYTNLAVGIDLKPANWISLNIAPVTGGVVIVRDELLRQNYGMNLKKEYETADLSQVPSVDLGSYYKSARFEFGAQIKADVTGLKLSTLQEKESACLGTAILAGVGCGVYANVEDACRDIIRTKKTYEPSGVDYTAAYNQYKKLDSMLNDPSNKIAQK